MDNYPALISKLPDDNKHSKIFLQSCQAGFLQLVKFLYPKIAYRKKALKRAVRQGHSEVVQFFLNSEPDYLQDIFLAFSGHLEVLKIILKEDIPYFESYDYVLGHYTQAICRYGHFDSLRYFLDNESPDPEMVLTEVVEWDYPESLKLVIQRYPDVDKSQALAQAISCGNIENILILLDAGANLPEDSDPIENLEIQDILTDRI